MNPPLNDKMMSKKSLIWSIVRIFLAESFASGISVAAVMLLAPAPNATLIAALTVGMSIYCAIWVTFPVSGAHINPMITLSVVITRRLHIAYLPLYWTAQFLGSLGSLSLGYQLSPHVPQNKSHGMTMPAEGVTDYQAVTVEALATFTLIMVVLGALDELRPETWRLENGNNFPFAIMCILVVNIILTDSITGASMNPWRSLTAAIINNSYSKQWIYFVGPMVGTVVATFFYEIFFSFKASGARTRAWLCTRDFDRSTACA